MWIFVAPLIFQPAKVEKIFGVFCFSEACQPVTSVPATFRRGSPQFISLCNLSLTPSSGKNVI